MSNALKIAAAMGGGGTQSLYGIISSLGLTTNLKLCLDAGDAASYNPGVQTAKWLDTSGNGYDFYRGESGAGDGAEPTFNGNAGGLSSAEYFSFDGGDYFLYDSANEAWMDALHNDGAIWSAFAMTYFTTTAATRHIFSTAQGVFVPTSPGAAFSLSNADALRYQCVNSGGIPGDTIARNSATGTNVWGGVGLGVTENGGAGASTYLAYGGVTGTFNATNAFVNASAPSAMTIGAASSDHQTKFPNNSRLACLAVWQGTTLTTANLSAIYNAIKGRFGL